MYGVYDLLLWYIQDWQTDVKATGNNKKWTEATFSFNELSQISNSDYYFFWYYSEKFENYPTPQWK